MTMIRKRYWVTGLVVVALTALVLWSLQPSPPSGPWRAQIVDAENGQPLEGVIVLALWDKRSFGWPHADRTFHDIDEVVSDANGRFVIPARTIATRHPFERIIGPIVTMFKPGYGQWKFQGAPAPFSEDRLTSRQRSGENRDRFARGGVVIVLPRVKTREERLQMLGRVMPSMDVPAARFPRLRAAYSEERVRLGLTPLH
jgi:hypothetical protein